jgi:hypothetical protein
VSLDPAQVREVVIAAYPGSQAWPQRVKKMSDPQLFAIYMRIINTTRSEQANAPSAILYKGPWVQ